MKVLHDLRWIAAAIIPGELQRRAARGEPVPDLGPPPDVDSVFSELPLGSHPLIPETAAFYAEWLAHDTADAYWQPISPAHWYERVTTPASISAGGTMPSCGARCNTIRACANGAAQNMRAVTNT